MKNILLVYPEVPENTYWSFKHALKFVHKKSSMPPLGLITIAALIPDKYCLRLIDMNIGPLLDNDIRWADAVFISAMSIQKDSFMKSVSACKRLNVTVVAGGPYPTSCHKEIQDVDHFILGEVEDTLKIFLDDYENGRAKKIYLPETRPDLSNSRAPRFDLLDMKAYSSMSIQYSRGCPFKCEFCDIWISYGNNPRLKSSNNIILELESLYNLKWRGPVFIVDDNFIGNKSRVKSDLLPAITEWQQKHGHVYRFFTEASINLADDEELMNGMKNAGFNEVFIGIETPSREALKETGKFQNLKTDLNKAVHKIQRHGMGVMAGFIIGFDSDTEDIFDRQISFIQKAGIPQAMVGLLIALPGTTLFSRLKKEGRIKSDSTGNNTHSMNTNFATKMDSAKLKDGYKRVLDYIYDTNLKNYFARCNILLDNIGNTPFFQRKVSPKDIGIFFDSFFRQSFKCYSFNYLRFLARNLLKHKKIFAEAVRFGIIGHHFYTITREMNKMYKIQSSLETSYFKFLEQIGKYSEAAKINSQETLGQAGLFFKQSKKSFELLRKKALKIDTGFREQAIKKFNEVSKKAEDVFKEFEHSLLNGS
jgi:radical SAM superfamily enzyme YgiQ (UPF0313 family)